MYDIAKENEMMIVNKDYRYRTYPTDTQKYFFAKTIGCIRYIYNVMSNDKIQNRRTIP